MPLSCCPPLILSGGLPSSLSINAPISVSGLITRPIGRFDNDSSPINSQSKSCAAKIPDISRIEVPEFPKSSGFEGFFKPLIPTP